MIVWDFEARPLPELPFPNNYATRYDPDSPTKRRINVSELATTRHEEEVRRVFNELDGFGTYAPLTVSFESPLDLRDLYARHNEHNPDQGQYRDDFRDDAVYLLNIDQRCDRYGEEVALDLGRGRFPVTFFRGVSVENNPEAPQGYQVRNRSLYPFSLFDPHQVDNNLLFEELSEDLNQNGTLDPGEDRDGDGRLDLPNFIDPSACEAVSPGTAGFDQVAYSRCVADNLLTFYERESDTLILRPVWPLEERCSYAVVLTKRLVGEDGEPVRSPFPEPWTVSQREPLKTAVSLLGRYGLGAEDVAFAWTFTTGTQTRDLEALREGLRGRGPFSTLDAAYPPDWYLWTREELSDRPDQLSDEERTKRSLDGRCVGFALARFNQIQREWEPNLCAIEADNATYSHIFGGVFKSPDLLFDRDGESESPATTPVDVDEEAPPTLGAEKGEPAPGELRVIPGSQDERWRINPEAGLIEHQANEVTFWCGLPQEPEDEPDCEPDNPEGIPFCKPYPVILYAHGYGGSKGEVVLSVMGRSAAMGYALCAIDSYGSGLNVVLEGRSAEAQTFRAGFSLLNRYGVNGLARLLLSGRDRDLTNDGEADPGMDQWTSDLFHTRDMVRQTALDYMTFVRILRSMDGVHRDSQGELLGDIDGDGVVDLGGPKTTLGMWGISLGGIIAGVLAGAEPSLDAVSPNAGGAGLGDIAVRSSQAGVPEAVLMPIMGPFVIGCMATDANQRPIEGGQAQGCFNEELAAGELQLAFLLQSRASQEIRPFNRVDGVRAGDRVLLKNLDNGEEQQAYISARGALMVAVAADALDPVEKRTLIGPGLALTDEDQPISESERLGDRLRLSFTHEGEDQPYQVIDRFDDSVSFEGVEVQSGAPLVALQEGLGLRRNSPKFRRFIGLAQHALGPGDPAIWGPKTFLDPSDWSWDPTVKSGGTHVLHMPTAGDAQVPVNTGIAGARVSGLLGSWRRDPSIGPEYGWRELFLPDARFNASLDQYLIDTFVVEGDGRLQRYPDASLNPNTIFDVDDTSDGTARFLCNNTDWSAMNGESGCPDELRGSDEGFPLARGEEPLRLNRARGDGSYDSLRVPVLRPKGQHGIYNAQSFRIFDNDTFMTNWTTRFLGSGGRNVDHPAGCDCSASQIPELLLDGRPHSSVSAPGDFCEEDELKLCDTRCAEAWGIRTPRTVSCDP